MGHPVLLGDMIRGREKSGDGDNERDRSQKDGLSAQPIVQLGKEKLEDVIQHFPSMPGWLQGSSDGGRIEAQSSHVHWVAR